MNNFDTNKAKIFLRQLQEINGKVKHLNDLIFKMLGGDSHKKSSIGVAKQDIPQLDDSMIRDIHDMEERINTNMAWLSETIYTLFPPPTESYNVPPPPDPPDGEK